MKFLFSTSLLVLAFSGKAYAQSDEIDLFIDDPQLYDSEILDNGTGTYYRSKNRPGNFYVHPELHIDIAKAQKVFDRNCDNESSKKFKFPFVFHMYPKEMLLEAKDIITKKESELKTQGINTNTAIRVNGFPNQNIIIKYGASESSPIAEKKISPRFLTTTINLQPKYNQNIRLTCNQAKDVFADGILDIEVQLALRARSYIQYSVEAQLNYFFNEVLEYDVDRIEKQRGGIYYRTRGKARSGGLLGSIIGGSTSTNTEANTLDTRKRYITVDAFNESFENFGRRLDIRVVRDGASTDGKSLDEIVKLLKEEAVKGLEPEIIEFRKGAACKAGASNNTRCMVVDNLKKDISDSWTELVDSISGAVASSSASISGDCIKAARTAAGDPTPAAEGAADAATPEGAADEATPEGENPTADSANPSADSSSECDLKSSQSSGSTIRVVAGGDTGKKWVPTSVKAYGVSSDYFSSSSTARFSDRTYLSDKKDIIIPINVEGTLDDFEKVVSPNSKLHPYTLSLKLGQGGHKSIPVDMSKLKKYCSDVDGCLLTLSMNTWAQSIPDGNKASYGPVSFFYNPETKAWRTSETAAGGKAYSRTRASVLNDGKNAHVMRSAGCFFTENFYNLSERKLDDDENFYLHAAGTVYEASYPFSEKVCTLIIRN